MGLLPTPDGIVVNTKDTVAVSKSLRKSINGKCRDCIYDDLAAGTWLQQVTLCSSLDCPLYRVRPQTKASIPENVLTYYGIAKTGTSQDLVA